MKSINEVYPEGLNHGQYDYRRLLQSFDLDIILQIDERGYQGDSWVLFQDLDTEAYGYLQFGWGSCSGCDALQGRTSLEEIDKLRNELYDSIKWFPTAEEALKWFETHDWSGDYVAKERGHFVAAVKEILKART